MDFWKLHDISLLKTWNESVKLMEDFEKENDLQISSNQKTFENLLNKKLGKRINGLSKISIAYSLKSLN